MRRFTLSERKPRRQAPLSALPVRSTLRRTDWRRRQFCSILSAVLLDYIAWARPSQPLEFPAPRERAPEAPSEWHALCLPPSFPASGQLQIRVVLQLV
mmetsp:Transcript_3004/g.9361  ORF Transcript_3004/g.9361 Transcript_3004/m.9361 type:complete len:98 (-) Transcript_3004:30-323(-)